MNKNKPLQQGCPDCDKKVDPASINRSKDILAYRCLTCGATWTRETKKWEKHFLLTKDQER